MIRNATFGFMLLGCILVCFHAHGSVVVPAGLNPGDHYYLAFVTQGTRDGSSGQLADYNQFVQTQAALNPALTSGATWNAVASTGAAGAVAAVNLNLNPNYPVYSIDGLTKIVDGTGGSISQFWLTPHLNPIAENQFGAAVPSGTLVWTGTDSFGGIQYPLGFLPPATVGSVGPVGPDWVDTGLNSGNISFTEPNTDLYPFYAVSSVLTVPQLAVA